jgi:hypothetical protein
MGERTDTPLEGVPETWAVDYVSPAVLLPVANVNDAIQTALEHPIATLPLSDVAGPDTQVCIATQTTARGTLNHALLHATLTTLQDAGVPASRITVVSPDAHTDIADTGVRFIVHDPSDIESVSPLGRFEGVEIQINHHAVEADVLIAISVMRLDGNHQDSGSSALVAMDLGSAATQRELRTARFLNDRIAPPYDGEPMFNRIVREGARRAGLAFAIDALVDEDGNALLIKAGAPPAVAAEVLLSAHTLREAPTGKTYDLLIAEPGIASIYRASRAAIQIGLAQDSALMRGGVMLFPVDPALAEDDAGEFAQFVGALEAGGSTADVIRQLGNRALEPGEDSAYLLAHVIQRHPVIAVGLDAAQSPRHLLGARTMAEATELAETMLGHKPRTLFLQRALSAVPVASRFQRSDDEVVDDLLRDIDLELVRQK